MLTLEQGKKLVKLAREAISSRLSNKKLKVDKVLKEEFSEYRGCFVTLKKGEELRGCIGYPEPILPLHDAIVSAAESAAFKDPRFPSLEKDEINSVGVEVSVLTKPKRIDVRNPRDYLKQIHIGKDGLIVRGTFNSGLLLPQVATEYKWDAKTFLSQTCVKAGLRPEDWHDFDLVRVYKFQSQVYSEKAPNGEIVQIM